MSFGSAGSAAGQISQARGVAIGPDGAIYLADAGNNRIDVFTVEGSFVRSIGREAVITETECDPTQTDHCQKNGREAAGVLSSPMDVALDAAGNVYVADRGNNRIDVFSPAGAFIRAFGKAVNPAGGNVCSDGSGCQRGSSGSELGVIAAPTGIGIDGDGLLYVAAANYRVDVFSSQGAFVRSIGKEVKLETEKCQDHSNCTSEAEAAEAGAMSIPYDVAVDAKGQVAVSDNRNYRIDVFTSQGSFVEAFGKGVKPAGGDLCTAASGCKKGSASAAAGGFSSSSAIAIGGDGNIYVADIGNNRIDEFGFNGSFVSAFGEGVVNGASAFQVCAPLSGCQAGLASANPGSVASPRGTAVDCTGAVYAVELPGEPQKDTTSSRVERFGEPGAPNPPCGKPSSSTVPPGADAPLAGLLAGSGGGFRVAKPSVSVELNTWNGTASLNVIVSEPGLLVLKGKAVHTARVHAKQPGLVELLLEAKGKTKKKLKAAHKAKVKALLGYEPDAGEGSTQSLSLVLKLSSRL